MHPDSRAWKIYALTSFGLSLAMMVVGVMAIPGEIWMKGFFLIGTFFLVGSCFTLSKTLRDEHESHNLAHKIDSARTEQLLRQWNTGEAKG